MEIELQKMNPLTASTEDWKKYHLFRNLIHQETSSDDPFDPDESQEASMKLNAQNEDYYGEFYLVYSSFDKSRVIGSLLLFIYTDKSPSYKGNDHFVQFQMNLLPESRRKGFGIHLFKKVVETAQRLKKPLLITSTSENSGTQFLRKLNFSFVSSNRQNRLQLNEVDWSMIEQWNKEGQERNPETKILFFDTVPDEFIDQFAPELTRTMSQEPIGDLNRGHIIATPDMLRKREKENMAIGNIPTTVFIVDSKNNIIAFSEMYYLKNTKLKLVQSFTGVNEKYRGRGLGKWVKASLLMYMSVHYPDAKFVDTGNNELNAPMLSINSRLGFKIHKEKISAQIEVKDALEQLKKFKHDEINSFQIV